MRWVIAFVLGAAAAAVAFYFLGGGAGLVQKPIAISTPLTTGSIYVSGPQVYTRERLVNDRYREDAWLLDELNHSTDADLNFGVTAHLITKDALQAIASLNFGQLAPAPATPAAPAASAAASPPAAPAASSPAVVTVDISPFDRFKARLAYREQIRSLLIENQLDDRHDLRGNSLYRLGFDVAVLPGENTRASAKVTVSVLPPEGLLGHGVTDASDNSALHEEEVKLASLSNLYALDRGQQGAWESVYAHWLASLEQRFDDGRATVQNAYDSPRFTPTEYDLLLRNVRDGVREFWQRIRQLHDQLAAFGEAKTLLDANQTLLTGIQNEDPGLVDPDAATKQAFARYRSQYISLAPAEIAKLHLDYQGEISRLLTTIAAERELLFGLSFLAQKQAALAPPSPAPPSPAPPSPAPPSPATSSAPPLSTTPSSSTPSSGANPPAATPPGALTQQQQADLGCGDLATYGTLSAPPDPFPPHTLWYFMDKAFEPSLFKSVLGLDAGSIRVVTSAAQSPPTRNLIYLNQLALIGSSYGALGTAFTFKRQTVPLVLTDNAACFPSVLNGMVLSTDAGTIMSTVSNGIKVYYLKKNLEDIGLLLSGYDPGPDIASIAAQWAVAANASAAATMTSNTPAATTAPGAAAPTTTAPAVANMPAAGTKARVATKTIEVGLINFIRTAGRRLDAFSYALVPAEPDELTAIQAQVDRNRSITLGASAPVSLTTIGGSAGLANQTGSDLSRIATRKQVVGFGDQFNSAIATFGWVVNPQDRVSDTEYRQGSSQMSLTALVSLPAWLEEVRVRVTRSWTDPSSAADKPIGKPSEYTVELPVNFETVDASLFETNDRSPTIFEWAIENKTIRPCEVVDILIPGARLWRSTVVTLGSQKADEIYVLPDMNGIIASFRPVQFPSTWSDLAQDFHVPLTVWTSQGSTAGSTAVPIYATFKSAALGKDPKPIICPPLPPRGGVAAPAPPASGGTTAATPATPAPVSAR